MKGKIVNSILIFMGLMLSPVTWWNDPFVNIPISYFLASITAHFSARLFFVSFLIFYWLTNILGVYLLYIGGKGFVKAHINEKKQVITVILYSILIILLSIYGIIKPVTVK